MDLRVTNLGSYIAVEYFEIDQGSMRDCYNHPKAFSGLGHLFGSNL
jgi:hypothetical protein